MANDWRLWIAAITAMAVAGCATTTTPPGRQAFNAEAHRDVRRLVIVEPAPLWKISIDPGHAQIAGIFGGTGNILGLFIALPILGAAMLDQSAKTQQFTTKAAAARQEINDALVTTLAERLSESGFQVSRHKMARPSADGPDRLAWVEDYGRWAGSADAALDLQVVVGGFVARDSVAAFKPFLAVAARLVDTRTRAIYYRDILVPGLPFIGPGQGVAGDPKNEFATFDDLLARSDDAVEALRRVAATLAQQVAAELSPP